MLGFGFEKTGFLGGNDDDVEQVEPVFAQNEFHSLETFQNCYKGFEQVKINVQI